MTLAYPEYRVGGQNALEGVCFARLKIAAKRLNLDFPETLEAALHGMGNGLTETEAMRVTIVELLQRRGAYHGRLKDAVDSGLIFQLRAEDEAPPASPAAGDAHAREAEPRPAGER